MVEPDRFNWKNGIANLIVYCADYFKKWWNPKYFIEYALELQLEDEEQFTDKIIRIFETLITTLQCAVQKNT